VLEHTSIRDKETIIRAIESLVPAGSTNAEEGLVLGYKLAEKSFRKGAINRIILCSDGVANVGRTGADDILKRIEEQVKKGITLSSIGFGLGNYNDVLLEKLGNKGNGYYAYVNNMQDAHKIFVDNLTGALEVIARDVKIQIDFDPEKVDRYRLLGFENRDVDDDKFRDDTVDGGEIGSGHSCTALYELKLKDGVTGSVGKIAIRFKNPDNDEVTEISREIAASDFSKSFVECNSRYRLAVVAAEFAEILRCSYWAKESQLSHVLEITHNLSRGMTDDQDVIELLDLVSKASNLKPQEG
jgi:Ca-activated chloride channel family protein